MLFLFSNIFKILQQRLRSSRNESNYLRLWIKVLETTSPFIVQMITGNSTTQVLRRGQHQRILLYQLICRAAQRKSNIIRVSWVIHIVNSTVQYQCDRTREGMQIIDSRRDRGTTCALHGPTDIISIIMYVKCVDYTVLM